MVNSEEPVGESALKEKEDVSIAEHSQEEKISPKQAGETLSVENARVVEPDWWVPLVEFACHIVVGTGIFVVIGTPAVVLDCILKRLVALEISTLILSGLTLAKIAVFVVDIGLYLIYLANTSWRYLRGMKWRK